ncbi:TetR family transcriptional regulator [Streptacidiphilus pinicola]|uniref:TetR family transcriptional regulator n=1 Tax=Streptacidiphilus pinicola TaxID=2219663 RepID=A0A2X0I7S4_9ACTN|nr:TetR/AcrR family transcriptional regulator [Streptacidiphilus pinicola]RAG80627.1 TetR family transcriptional regulator [Streptacidiphilus pinicola]
MQARRYHHGDLRAALLASAERVLRERGSGELSLRELAREAGVSHAAPSRHFKDKQALLDALAREGFDRMDAALRAAVAAAGESFADRLDALARAYVGFATGNAVLLDLMYTVKHDAAASAELAAASRRLGELAFSLLTDAQARGEIPAGPVEAIGLPVFSTLHGFADLAVNGTLTPADVTAGLGPVVAYMLRGCGG